MYPPPPPPSSSASSSSCSSSSHGSMASTAGPNLTRYGSAPSSLLVKAVDSITNNTRFGSNATSSTTTTTANVNNGGLLQRSYCFNNIPSSNNNQFKISSEGSSLIRHNSSPAGFLNRLATATAASDNVSRGLAVYNSKGGCDSSARGISRLNSQLSFTKDCLSQITEETDGDDNDDDAPRKEEARSYATANFGMGSWDDTNGVIFSTSPNKRAKTINTTDISNGFNIIDSQLQFGSTETALEMATIENLIDIPQDSVPCKVRAKRGCATHPRSIAERERRTRISGKLKKLQDLVPNMDKQTSYADMLDLAVQHIKGLQSQVQKLHKEAENCTCGCGSNYN